MTDTSHWYYYLENARKIVRPGDSVLKVDGYNELLDLPIEGGIGFNLDTDKICIVEYEDVFVNKLKTLYPGKNILTGDIRELPIEDNHFDVILDMSTIDHIPSDHLDLAFSEYKRVLKPKGKLFIVAWIAENPMVREATEERGKDWSSLNQYFFSPVTFQKKLLDYFNILDREKIKPDGDTYMLAYQCQNKV